MGIKHIKIFAIVLFTAFFLVLMYQYQKKNICLSCKMDRSVLGTTTQNKHVSLNSNLELKKEGITFEEAKAMLGFYRDSLITNPNWDYIALMNPELDAHSNGYFLSVGVFDLQKEKWRFGDGDYKNIEKAYYYSPMPFLELEKNSIRRNPEYKIEHEKNILIKLEQLTSKYDQGGYEKKNKSKSELFMGTRIARKNNRNSRGALGAFVLSENQSSGKNEHMFFITACHVLHDVFGNHPNIGEPVVDIENDKIIGNVFWTNHTSPDTDLAIVWIPPDSKLKNVFVCNQKGIMETLGPVPNKGFVKFCHNSPHKTSWESGKILSRITLKKQLIGNSMAVGELIKVKDFATDGDSGSIVVIRDGFEFQAVGMLVRDSSVNATFFMKIDWLAQLDLKDIIINNQKINFKFKRFL